jgi:hypothetical protein
MFKDQRPFARKRMRSPVPITRTNQIRVNEAAGFDLEKILACTTAMVDYESVSRSVESFPGDWILALPDKPWDWKFLFDKFGVDVEFLKRLIAIDAAGWLYNSEFVFGKVDKKGLVELAASDPYVFNLVHMAYGYPEKTAAVFLSLPEEHRKDSESSGLPPIIEAYLPLEYIRSHPDQPFSGMSFSSRTDINPDDLDAAMAFPRGPAAVSVNTSVPMEWIFRRPDLPWDLLYLSGRRDLEWYAFRAVLSNRTDPGVATRVSYYARVNASELLDSDDFPWDNAALSRNPSIDLRSVAPERYDPKPDWEEPAVFPFKKSGIDLEYYVFGTITDATKK